MKESRVTLYSMFQLLWLWCTMAWLSVHLVSS